MIDIKVVSFQKLRLKAAYDFFYVTICIKDHNYKLFAHKWFQDDQIDIYPKINQSIIHENQLSVVSAIHEYFLRFHL